MGRSCPARHRSRVTALGAVFHLALILEALSKRVGAQQVFRPSDPVSVFVWKGSDQPGFEYPELSEVGDWGIPRLRAKPNLGVALSGGGYRAATLAVGWARGLYLLGLLPLARYMSSNSGGSWFNGPLSYSGFPVGPFLGPYVPPANLSRGSLGSRELLPPGSFGETLADKAIISDAIKGVLIDLVVPGRESFSGWTEAIARAFLGPYGLDLQNSSITAQGTRGNVSTRLAAAYPGVPLYTAMATPDRPFPVILGSIMRVGTPQVFYPFECTPLYVGDPAPNLSLTPPLGPGFIEPLGFNSPQPGAPPPGPAPPVGLQGAVNVTPFKLVPLATYMGISSSFVSQGVRPSSTAGFAATGTERLNYWSPSNYSAGDTLSFADGAGVDNLALTPLLRRRVTHIVAGVAALTPANLSPADWAVAQYDVAGLFGAVPLNATSYEGLKEGLTGVQPDVFNRALQVFPREGYDELYDTLRGGLTHGQPAIHRASYEVLPNAAQAITGGWQVEVLWLFNMQASEWEAQLPIDTRDFLNLNRANTGSDLHQYPHISTYTANYSPELVTLLSQQATWTVLQAASELLDLLEGSGVSPPGMTPAGRNDTAANASANATSHRTAAPTGGGSSGGINATSRGAPAAAAANSSQPLNSSALGAVEARAAATLVQLAQQPPLTLRAGVAPPLAQVEQLGGGLPEDVRQPRNSYTMALGGPPAELGGGDAAETILLPAKNESVYGGAAGGGAAGGRWWHAGLMAAAVAVCSVTSGAGWGMLAAAAAAAAVQGAR